MTKRNRRQFLEESMLTAAATAATVSGIDELFADSTAAGRSVNDQLGIAVVGVRGRGNSHLRFFAARRDTRILYVCDVDRNVGSLRARQVAKRQGGPAPKWVEDLRRVLEDPRVDIVSIAAPNHWHALAAIWAMQAGKDVYVEKPVSHNVQEGRRMVEAARRYQRICQSGLQARSNPGMISAIDFVRTGGIGTVHLARGICYKRRRVRATSGEFPVPRDVNYDLWLGPAPAAPVTRQRFHSDWQWQRAYGNGELGNQGLHQLDVCRWGLQLPSISRSIFSYGARAGTPGSAPLPSTLVSVHDFGNKSIVTEIRAPRSQPLPRVQVGVIFEGSDGYVVMTSYHSGTAFDVHGQPMRHFRGGGGGEPHFRNFLNAVRQRSCLHLNADIEEGHLSSALAHVGNISYQLGRDIPLSSAKREFEKLPSADRLLRTWERTERHLLERTGDHKACELRLGKLLVCDPNKETFVNDQRADCLLTRRYRRPFVVPAAGNV